jgi:hypothetical protein
LLMTIVAGVRSSFLGEVVSLQEAGEVLRSHSIFCDRFDQLSRHVNRAVTPCDDVAIIRKWAIIAYLVGRSQIIQPSDWLGQASPRLSSEPLPEVARLEAGETQADVARTYNVDATTIGRLLQ